MKELASKTLFELNTISNLWGKGWKFLMALTSNKFSITSIKLIKDIASLNLSDTKKLAASIRDPQSVGKAFNNGAHICTLPPLVFDKMYKHVLTDAGIAQFNKDHAETSS